jgi:cytochrome P450
MTLEKALEHVFPFASGPHYCLGAPLARLEMQVFLERLLLKCPDFSVPDQEIDPNFILWGLKRLEFKF